MVRGYQKRIIHLKNTESDAFDEAFFLVSESGSGMCERELIAEANRIIDESVSGEGRKREGSLTGHGRALGYAFSFIFGAAVASLICILLTIV